MPHEIRLEPGGLNPGLCDLGVAQAKKLALEVKLLGFKKAYCSPSARTIATAKNLEIEIVICDDLNYVQLKEDRIRAFAKEVEENPDYWKEFWTSRNFPGLETPEKFLARIKKCLKGNYEAKRKSFGCSPHRGYIGNVGYRQKKAAQRCDRRKSRIRNNLCIRN